MAPNIRLQYGPMLLGVCFNMILYGVLIVQCYYYYLKYKADRPWIKLLVLYLFIVESVNTACDIYIVYQPLIERFGLPEATKYFPTLFAAEPVTIVAISTPIQLFFAWRVWLFTKSKLLPAVIVSLSFVSLGGGIWTTCGLINIKIFSRKPELHTPALVWFLSACAADLIITIVLVYTLQKRKTGFITTDDVISKIIRLTVQTGLITTCFAIGDVLFFMTLPRTALNFLWDLALTKLYANCLLSTLNARASLQVSTRSTVDSIPRQMPPGPVPRRLDGGFALEPISFGKGHSRNTPASGSDASVKHFMRSSMYDEEAAKSFDRHVDMEYGITITKVIETKEDPPTMTIHTQ